MLARLLIAVLFLAPSAVKVPDLKDFKVKSAFDNAENAVGYNEDEKKIFMYTNGTATAEIKFTDDGEYTITVEASCDEAKNEKAKIAIKLGDEVVTKSFELKATEAKEYTFTAKVKSGTHKFVVEFLNDEYKENEFDRNFYLHAVKIEPKK